MTRVLLAGVSTRAAAESAARAGFDVTAIDGFGDVDQHPSVHAMPLTGGFTIGRASRAARAVSCDAVAYLSSFENHPSAINALARNRMLWGNPPAILRRVRDPVCVSAALRHRGLAAPAVGGVRPWSALCVDSSRHGPSDGRWLVKPLRSGGGHDVRDWDGAGGPAGAPGLSRGTYLQEFIDGVPGSVVFVAAGRRAVPIGLSRQLVGEADFAASGYRYCGNIIAPAGDPQFARDGSLAEAACALACAATEEFGLIGLNGIDFVARDGVPFAVEINPRWCASMELVERAYGLTPFELHAAACAGGALPLFDLLRARQASRAVGKAIVFARHDIVVQDTSAWLSDKNVRDIPRPDERISAGRPICTVLADADSGRACYAELVRRANRLYAEVAAWNADAGSN